MTTTTGAKPKTAPYIVRVYTDDGQERELHVTARDWWEAGIMARRLLAWREGQHDWQYRHLNVRVFEVDTGKEIGVRG